MKLEQENCCGELLHSEVHTSAPEKGTYMPSEEDISRVIEKISRLDDEQLDWFIHQMQHQGFFPCDETYPDPK